MVPSLRNKRLTSSNYKLYRKSHPRGPHGKYQMEIWSKGVKGDASSGIFSDVSSFQALLFTSVRVRFCHLVKISWELASCLCFFKKFSLQTRLGEHFGTQNCAKISTLNHILAS